MAALLLVAAGSVANHPLPSLQMSSPGTSAFQTGCGSAPHKGHFKSRLVFLCWLSLFSSPYSQDASQKKQFTAMVQACTSPLLTEHPWQGVKSWGSYETSPTGSQNRLLLTSYPKRPKYRKRHRFSPSAQWSTPLPGSFPRAAVSGYLSWFCYFTAQVWSSGILPVRTKLPNL